MGEEFLRRRGPGGGSFSIITGTRRDYESPAFLIAQQTKSLLPSPPPPP